MTSYCPICGANSSPISKENTLERKCWQHDHIFLDTTPVKSSSELIRKAAASAKEVAEIQRKNSLRIKENSNI